MVMISEFVGGGFGSKIPGSLIDNVSMIFARKINRPVMLRVTRDEETYFGRARPGLQGWVKVGLRASDGRIMAMDLLMIQDSGPYSRPGDYQSAAQTASLAYQPVNMRFRGVGVVTNTPPKGAQRGPGGAQAITMISPVLDEAARQAGVDRMDMLYVNAPEGRAPFGPAQTEVTSAFGQASGPDDP
jgi:xanthine dehydrogenase molybdenum-binding subunit